MTPRAPQRIASRKNGAGAAPAWFVAPRKTTAFLIRRCLASGNGPPTTSRASREAGPRAPARGAGRSSVRAPSRAHQPRRDRGEDRRRRLAEDAGDERGDRRLLRVDLEDTRAGRLGDERERSRRSDDGRRP